MPKFFNHLQISNKVSLLVAMAVIRTISFLFIFCLFESDCDFPSDYLGNYLSDDEYNSRTFCWTKICMEDSGRLIYAADHDSNKTSPCDDFKTFALGEFHEHRVLNDRYPKLSFISNANLQYFEKQKRMLLKPANASEPKIFKMMRSFFRQCINFSKNFCFKLFSINF